LMDKKNALNDTKAKLAQVTEKLKLFDGIDLDEVKGLLKERKEAQDRELEAKGEWDRLKTNLVEQHARDKADLEAKIAELQTMLSGKDASINNLTIGSAFGQSRYIADELTLTPSKAQIIFGGHFEFQEGKIVAYDKPKGAAERTLSIDSSGEALSFDAALAKLVESDQDRDHLIRSKAKPGANSGEGKTDPAARKAQEANITGIDRIAKALSKKK